MRGFDEVWVLGDIVGYGPQPNEVIQCLRDLSAAGTVVTAVGGNHEHAVLGVYHPLEACTPAPVPVPTGTVPR